MGYSFMLTSQTQTAFCKYIYNFKDKYLYSVNYSNLYFNSVLVGCSFYLLTQLIRLSLDWSRASWSEIIFLVGAGLIGGASLVTIREEYCWLCKNLGPWSIQVSCGSSEKSATISFFVLQGLWYYGSDVSMFLLGVYILESRFKRDR